jgi:hypothetical protein
MALLNHIVNRKETENSKPTLTKKEELAMCYFVLCELQSKLILFCFYYMEGLNDNLKTN